MTTSTINYIDFLDEEKTTNELRKKYEEELFVTAGSDLNGWMYKRYKHCALFYYPATQLMGIYVIIKPTTPEDELERNMKVEMISGYYVNEKEDDPIGKAFFNASKHFLANTFEEVSNNPHSPVANSFALSKLYESFKTHCLVFNEKGEHIWPYTAIEKLSSRSFKVEFDDLDLMRYTPTSSDAERMKEFTGRYKIEIFGGDKERNLRNLF